MQPFGLSLTTCLDATDRKPPLKRLSAAIGLLICLPHPACAGDDRAAYLVKLFIEACVPNMGNPDGVRAWAVDKHLGQISEAAALAIFVGPGNHGAAWAIPTQYGKFALSIRGTTQACAVYAHAADPTEVETDFKTIVESVKQPGIRLRVDKDATTDGPAGRARALAYNMIAPGAPSGYEFIMLTAERAGGAFQASIQVAKASAD
jgi:hypothetical protein